jgi:energy-coupling factor transporter ATP-binding protein EcfA2
MTEIETRDLWFSYPDGSDALKSISLEVEPGEYLALVGQNGSGKTTLAKHLLGLLRPKQGQVLIQGEDIRDKPVGEIARCVGYVFQNPDHQIFSPTTTEEISYGPKNLQLEEDEISIRTKRAIDRFDLARYTERQPAILSYGSRRKVALASVYAMDPQIWILDEPTGGLDWRSEQETMSLLREQNQAGKTIVLITHDMRLVSEHAKRCIVMSRGRIIADDETREIMEQGETLGITPPQIWRLSKALHHQPPALAVDTFCREYGRQLASGSEINVGRS